ncbi:MAG TPA: hypothetical protein VFG69_11840 [Nannocystaceae bacterium]|nr:hypothetical protein [Nannocystaceae bacterium]
MRRFESALVSLLGLLTLSACAKDTSGDGGDDTGATDTGGITNSTMSASDTGSASVTETAETAGSMSADGTTAADASATMTEGDSADSAGSSDATGNNPGDPLDCGGKTYTCGDMMDNDGDGLVDLMDPECTGPCDDDEGSYQTGIPGDNVDCKQDCFFDGNSGQGDDGCIWDLKCDEANPGEFIGCEYSGGNNCGNGSPNQSEDCIMFCEQFVPPGCDCFGCCTVCPDGGECVDIFLNGDPDCNVDNLDACTMCTSQIEECGNPCVPEECEICFGTTEPPEGCDGNECISDLPCMDQGDCPTDFFCYLGCCYPPPPG